LPRTHTDLLAEQTCSAKRILNKNAKSCYRESPKIPAISIGRKRPIEMSVCVCG